MLAGRRYVATEHEPTVVDIVCYNEIATVLLLSNYKGFKRQFPHVSKWINIIVELNELIQT